MAGDRYKSRLAIAALHPLTSSCPHHSQPRTKADKSTRPRSNANRSSSRISALRAPTNGLSSQWRRRWVRAAGGACAVSVTSSLGSTVSNVARAKNIYLLFVWVWPRLWRCGIARRSCCLVPKRTRPPSTCGIFLIDMLPTPPLRCLQSHYSHLYFVCYRAVGCIFGELLKRDVCFVLWVFVYQAPRICDRSEHIHMRIRWPVPSLGCAASDAGQDRHQATRVHVPPARLPPWNWVAGLKNAVRVRMFVCELLMPCLYNVSC